MMTKKRTIGLVLICLLTVGIASVYAAEGGDVFDDLRTLFGNMQDDIDNIDLDIQDDLDAINDNIEDHTSQIAELQAMIITLEEKIDEIEPSDPSDLEERIVALEDEVFGIPEGPQATFSLSERIIHNLYRIYPLQSTVAALEDEVYGTETLKGLKVRVGILFGHYNELLAQLGECPTEYESTEVWILAIENDLQMHDYRLTDLEALPTGLGAPDFVSPWFTINQGQSISLGTVDSENILVYMVGHSDPSGSNMHQIHYGEGAWWKIEDYPSHKELTVYREPTDQLWWEVRLMYWQLPPTTP